MGKGGSWWRRHCDRGIERILGRELRRGALRRRRGDSARGEGFGEVWPRQSSGETLAIRRSVLEGAGNFGAKDILSIHPLLSPERYKYM